MMCKIFISLLGVVWKPLHNQFDFLIMIIFSLYSYDSLSHFDLVPNLKPYLYFSMMDHIAL